MKLNYLKHGVGLFIILLTAIQCIAQQLQNTIVFPVEVFGKNGATESVAVNLNSASNNAKGLRLTVHGLTYTNKASIKINNSQWYDISNSNIVYLNTYEAAAGGMGTIYFYGPFSTFHFVVPIASTNFTTYNSVTFRFNDLNGLTVGYRVLDIGIVDSSNKDLPLYTRKVNDDPSKWKPYSTNAANINNGSNQWYTANIKHNGVPIKAKCNDCHVDGGYDLKYFNYSNKSIVLRSTALHSLSLQDAQDIASFIRSINIPYEEKGRPWNPAYQPGPGLDSKPVRSWAAGAGLEWVLWNDMDTLTNIFPNGTASGLVNYGTNGVVKYNPELTLNQRETPVYIAMPDWNRWLPIVHPLDGFPTIYPTTNAWTFVKYRQVFQSLVNMTNAATQGISLVDNGMQQLFDAMFQQLRDPNFPFPANLGGQSRGGGYRSKDYAEWVNKRNSVFKWVNVKNFEFMKLFQLEELGAWKWGDARRWYKNRIFFTAPHVTSVPVDTDGVGMVPYAGWGPESTSWYELAMILDSGSRNNIDQDPLDQGYFARFGNSMLPYAQNGMGGWYQPNWPGFTNRPYGLLVLNHIKAMEFTEKGATNVPGKYWPPNWIIGYGPIGGTFTLNQVIGEAPNLDVIDKTIQGNVVNLFFNQLADSIDRFTKAQWSQSDYFYPSSVLNYYIKEYNTGGLKGYGVSPYISPAVITKMQNVANKLQ